MVEPSFGVDRTVYSVLAHAYETDEVDGEERTYLDLPPEQAPTTVGVFPLMDNDGMADLATDIADDLRAAGLSVTYDDSGAIGRRYRRQDEVGTPYCVTVDYESLEDDSEAQRASDSASSAEPRSANRSSGQSPREDGDEPRAGTVTDASATRPSRNGSPSTGWRRRSNSSAPATAPSTTVDGRRGLPAARPRHRRGGPACASAPAGPDYVARRPGIPDCGAVVVCVLEAVRLSTGLDWVVYDRLTREYEQDNVAGYALYTSG